MIKRTLGRKWFSHSGFISYNYRKSDPGKRKNVNLPNFWADRIGIQARNAYPMARKTPQAAHAAATIIHMRLGNWRAFCLADKDSAVS
jgi:hypothetical protein